MADKWEEAKRRYILSDITMEQLAEETGLSINTLRKKCAKEKWKAERNKQGKKRTKKALEKAVKRASEKTAKQLNESMEEELDLAKQIMRQIRRALNDQDQFAKHLVNIKGEKLKDGVFYTQWIEEQQFSKLDVKGIVDLAKALETVEGIHRRTSRQLTRLEEENLKLQKERLAIEREKLQLALKAAGKTEEGEETGIVLMPSVDMQQYEAEQQAYLQQLEQQQQQQQQQEGGI